MPKNLWSKKFDPDAEFVWRHGYHTGQPVVKTEFNPRRLKQLYDTRKVVMEDVWNEFVGVLSPTADKSGRVADSAPVSAPASDDPRAELRAQLDELGIEYDNRWGEKRLTEELEKATEPAKLPGM